MDGKKSSEMVLILDAEPDALPPLPPKPTYRTRRASIGRKKAEAAPPTIPKPEPRRTRASMGKKEIKIEFSTNPGQRRRKVKE